MSTGDDCGCGGGCGGQGGGAGGPGAGPCAGPSGCGCCQGVQALTPAVIINRPGLSQIAYRAGTHGSFLATMEAALSGAAEPVLRALGVRTPDDPSIAFLDCWATVGDVLTFYTERIANEGYLRTASELRSVLELARLTGYRLRPGLGASAYLSYTLQVNPAKVTSVVIGKGARAMSVPGPGQQPQAYETSDDLYAQQTWNTLPVRATTPATITEGQLQVQTGPGLAPGSHPGHPSRGPDGVLRRHRRAGPDIRAGGQRRRHRQRDHGGPGPRPAAGRAGSSVSAATPPAGPGQGRRSAAKPARSSSPRCSCRLRCRRRTPRTWPGRWRACSGPGSDVAPQLLVGLAPRLGTGPVRRVGEDDDSAARRRPARRGRPAGQGGRVRRDGAAAAGHRRLRRRGGHPGMAAERELHRADRRGGGRDRPGTTRPRSP